MAYIPLMLILWTMLWGRKMFSEMFQNSSNGVGGQGTEGKYVEGVPTWIVQSYYLPIVMFANTWFTFLSYL